MSQPHISQPRWALTDDDLLAAIKSVMTAPGVPDRLAEAAKASFTYRAMDQDLELLLLVGDSAADAPAGVRGPGEGLRLLDFRSAKLSLEVEVSATFVMGQLMPMQPGHLWLSTPDGPFAETDADATGSFRMPRPPSGPVRLVCRTEAAELATEWTRV